MSAKGKTGGWWVNLGLSLVVGAVFIYAGVAKIPDPLQFADSIASFKILPAVLVTPFALGLPFFEIFSGLLLIIGFGRRVGALAILIITAVFCVAIVSAIARGLTIDCGCFGGNGGLTSNKWMDLGRDVLLFAGALIVYRNARRGIANRKASPL